MKKILPLLALTTTLLFSEQTYENYEPQNFFSANDVSSFFKSETGEMLKKILVNGDEYYMQQDGDLFDEDVATIDDEVFGAKRSAFSFGKSKRLLATKVYPSHQKGFYSNCDYEVVEKKLVPIHKTCGFHYRKNKNRSERIEWEHVVPAWHFGHQLHCWQNGGRMTCRQTNTKFKKMEADMHNLVPAIGEINGDRSNFKYAMIEGEKRVYGKVDMEILFSAKSAEPSKAVYGDIARTYFYMRDRYGLKLSSQQEKMFIAWNNLDPVSQWEKKRNRLIKELQGDDNLYVSNYKKIKQLGAIKEEPNKSEENSYKDKDKTFSETKDELADKYSSILDKMFKPLGEILLFLVALFVFYKRQQKKRQEQTVKEVKETVGTDTVMFISKLGDKEMAIGYNDEDEVIIEESNRSNPRQQWVLNKPNQQKEYFFIENFSTGRVIEIENAQSNDGANIIINKKKRSKNDHQEWSIEASKNNGYIFLLNRDALTVLDIKYKKATNGTKLQSFHKKVRGTDNQEWKIKKL
jgi:deoxyribonuclease-1